MKVKTLILLLTFTLFSSSFILIFNSCASIVSKSEWPITIRSTPDQAYVTIVDLSSNIEIYSGTTPCIVTLTSKGGYFKGKSYLVKVFKEGHKEESIMITSTINGWYFGNFVFGGFIGLLIVDPLTGAMWTLEPKNISLVLKPETHSSIIQPEEDIRLIKVVSIDEIPVHLRSKLIRVR
mgnify:CR=1 FL=1